MKSKQMDIKKTALIALAAALAGAAGLIVAATSVHADDRLLDDDEVKVTSQGFDFGGGSYVVGGLTDSGTVQWLVDENTVTPVVTGELHLDNVDNECARMRVDYYSANSAFLRTEYGGTVCATGNSHQYWNVDLAPYTSNKIGKVKVSVEHELSNGIWAIVGSDWSTLNTYVDESVYLFSTWGVAGSVATGFDFGDNSWDLIHGHPMGSGQIEWELSNGQITPHLTGTLHLNNVAGACARMRIDYYADDDSDPDVFGEFLTTVYGGTVCAPDNSHYQWSVDRRDYSETAIRFVDVSIESLQSNGTWLNVGKTTSFFGT